MHRIPTHCILSISIPFQSLRVTPNPVLPCPSTQAQTSSTSPSIRHRIHLLFHSISCESFLIQSSLAHLLRPLPAQPRPAHDLAFHLFNLKSTQKTFHYVFAILSITSQIKSTSSSPFPASFLPSFFRFLLSRILSFTTIMDCYQDSQYHFYFPRLSLLSLIRWFPLSFFSQHFP